MVRLRAQCATATSLDICGKVYDGDVANNAVCTGRRRGRPHRRHDEPGEAHREHLGH